MKRVFITFMLFIVGFNSIAQVFSASSKFSKTSVFSDNISTVSSKEVGVETLDGVSDNLIFMGENMLTVTNTAYSFIKFSYKISDYVVIDDVDGDGVKDIAIILANSDIMHNVFVYSGKTGSKIWSIALSTTIDHPTQALQEYSLDLYKIALLDNNNLAIISDYSVFLIDSLSGNITGKYNAGSNIWSIKNVDESSFIIGCQNGKVVALNSDDAEQQWQNKLTKTLEFSHQRQNFKMNQSIYDLLVVDNKVYATAQDGRLYILDGDNGKLLHTQIIIDISEEAMQNLYIDNGTLDDNKVFNISEIGKTHPNFMAYKLQSLDDERIIIASNFGNSNLKSGSKSLNASLMIPTIQIYNLKANAIEAKYENSSLGLTHTAPLISTGENGSKEILLLSRGSKSLCKVLKLSTSLSVVEEIQTNLKTSDKMLLVRFNDKYLYQWLYDQTVEISSNFDNQRVIDNTSYYIPLVYDRNNYLLVRQDNNNKNPISVLRYFQNDTNNYLWDFDFVGEGIGSIIDVQSYQDNDGDGFDDFICVGLVDSNSSLISKRPVIFEIGSKDGKINSMYKLTFNDLVKIHYNTINLLGMNEEISLLVYMRIDIMDDFNNDGYAEILLDDIAIIDGKSKKPIHILETPAYYYYDNDGDGIAEIAKIIDGITYVFAPNVNCTTTNCTVNYEMVPGGSKINRYEDDFPFYRDLQVGDYNLDGIKDYGVAEVDENGNQYFGIYSGKDYSHIMDIFMDESKPWGSTIYDLGIDLDGDGISEYISASPSKSGLDIFSSKDHSLINSFVTKYNGDWTSFDREIDESISKEYNSFPVNVGRVFGYPNHFIVDDQNGDGEKELLVYGIYRENGKNYPCVYLYSLDNQEPLAIIKNDIPAAISVETEKYIVDEISAVYRADDNTFIFISPYGIDTVFNLEKKEFQFAFAHNALGYIELNNSILLGQADVKIGLTDYNLGQQLKFINDVQPLKINNIESGQTVKSGFDIDIDLAATDISVLKVLYKGEPIASSTTGSISVLLPVGQQEITIIGYSETGLLYSRTLSVNVKKPILSLLIHIVVSIVMGGVVITLTNLTKIRKRFLLNK